MKSLAIIKKTCPHCDKKFILFSKNFEYKQYIEFDKKFAFHILGCQLIGYTKSKK